MVPSKTLGFESAASLYTLPGQRESGDRHVVVSNTSGVLMAVVDGLGHGREAALGAQRAIDIIGRHSGELSLTALVRRCHDELQGTRGAVMSLAAISYARQTVTWLGVGNVEGRLVKRAPDITRKEETLLLRQGVVGVTLPQLQTAAVPIASGDLLVFATDGIDPGFAEHLEPAGDVQSIADGIVTRHCRGSDDALVLVVRCLG